MLGDNLPTRILASLNPLVNQKLNYIGRTADMLDIGFGENIEHTSFISGKKRMVSRFVLHVQSSWRMVRQRAIVVAQKDFYVAKDGLSYEKFQENRFGNSQFDTRVKMLNTLLRTERRYVSRVTANDLGDVTIHLGAEHRLEVFVDISGREESWRFFRMDDDSEHFVLLDSEQ